MKNIKSHIRYSVSVYSVSVSAKNFHFGASLLCMFVSVDILPDHLVYNHFAGRYRFGLRSYKRQRPEEKVTEYHGKQRWTFAAIHFPDPFFLTSMLLCELTIQYTPHTIQISHTYLKPVAQ